MNRKETYDITMTDNVETTEKKDTRVDVRNTVTTVEPSRTSSRPFKNSMKMNKTKMEAFKICIAEILGVTIYMWVGCLGCWTKSGDAPDIMVPSLTFGFAVFMAVQVVGHISGAHLNPSVTIAALILEVTTFPMAVIYMIGQFLGAITGYVLTKVVVPGRINAATYYYCATLIREDVSIAKALVFEVLATGLLVFVVCSMWDKRNKDNTDAASLKPGITVFVLVLAIGPFTGCSMNPARSLAPAVIMNIWTYHWIYWVGPLIGAIISAGFYRIMFWPGSSESSE